MMSPCKSDTSNNALPCIQKVMDCRRSQNVVRTSVSQLAAPHLPLFSSYQILTTSVICYSTDAHQHGIYLPNA